MIRHHRPVAVAAAAALTVAALLTACGTSTRDIPGPTVTARATVTATAVQTVHSVATVTAHPVVRKIVATRTRVMRVTYTPPPPTEYQNGTYTVGSEIQPGLYKADAGSSYCAWFRKSKVGAGLTEAIIDWGNSNGGPLTVQIEPSDKAFLIQGDCTFHRAG